MPAHRKFVPHRSREDQTPPLTGHDASPEEAETTEPDAPLTNPADAMGGPGRSYEDEPTYADLLPDHLEGAPSRRRPRR